MGISAYSCIRKFFGIVISSDLCLIGGRGWGQSDIGIYAFCFIRNFFSAVVLRRCIVD